MHLRRQEIFMDKEIASKIVHSTISLNEKIGDVDLAISEIPDEHERGQYVTAVGAILRTIREDILLQIFREHPDLNPYDK